MMKNNKKTIIFAICCVLVAFLAVGILLIISVNKAKDAEKRGVNEFVNLATMLYDYANSKKIGYSGVLEVTASYKGAHGEKHPANFNLIYELDIDSMNFASGDSNGYNESVITSKVLNFVKVLRTTDKDKYVKAFKDLDVKAINEIFGTSYKSLTIEVDKSGFFSDYHKAEVKLDDDVITLKENEYIYKKGKDTISIKTNNKGYSVNINNIFKMNAFPDKKLDEYNVVFNGYSFHITINNSQITLNTSSQSAIYNGLDLVFKYNTNRHVDKTTKIDFDEIPIFRYFKGVDTKIWK